MNCFLFAETDNLPSPDEDQDQGTGIDIDIDIKSGYELQVSPTEHVLSDTDIPSTSNTSENQNLFRNSIRTGITSDWPTDNDNKKKNPYIIRSNTTVKGNGEDEISKSDSYSETGEGEQKNGKRKISELNLLSRRERIDRWKEKRPRRQFAKALQRGRSARSRVALTRSRGLAVIQIRIGIQSRTQDNKRLL
mmetsp:Transcript_26997/g.32715  ORF Transcript_26997/g.32715 Transcript_26997/m.32715 type:complete len:192 (+) Transcript_26997:845-1420(+)